MKRPVIVGFDPGTTAGLAIIDTSGQLLFLSSKKEMKRNEILRNITARGKPIIISADRNPLPHNVEKLASTLGCRPFYPVRSLSSLEKIKLVGGFSDKIKNDHERDALAAALGVYKHYTSLFSKTRRELERIGLTKVHSSVLEKLITDEAENIEEAIEMSQEKMPKVEKEKITPKIEVTVPKNVALLEEELKRKNRDIEILKKYNEDLKKRIEYNDKELKTSLEKKSDGNIERLKNEIRKRNGTIKLLKDYRQHEIKDLMPVIEIKNIKKDETDELHNAVDLTNRIVYAKNPENAQILNDYNIRALITNTENMPKKINFPAIDIKDISIQQLNEYKVVAEKELEENVARSKKTGIVEWLETYKKRKI